MYFIYKIIKKIQFFNYNYNYYNILVAGCRLNSLRESLF